MRTFVAIDIPTEVKQQLRTAQDRLRALPALRVLPPVLRWTDPDKLHLTLRFLGETETPQIPQLQDGLAGVAKRHRPFLLVPSRLGCFSSWSNLRVMWVGIGGESEALQVVQTEVESLARQAGFSPEHKRFSPHITLARVVRNAPRAALREASQQLRSASEEELPGAEFDWRVNELHLIRSVLGRGGAQYFKLASHSLLPDA